MNPFNLGRDFGDSVEIVAGMVLDQVLDSRPKHAKRRSVK